MERPFPRYPAPAAQGVFLRSLTLLLALWMCWVPQVISSTTVLELYAEAGNTPLSLIEEEEVKHAGMEPPLMAKVFTEGPDGIMVARQGKDRLPGSLYGEVPHLPPWVGRV
jgi:hypothetical protein